jgi:hypothetical protein
MSLNHAVLLAEARSYLATLADHARNFDASMEYERLLLQLDSLHEGIVPPITVVPATDPCVLHDVARAAILNLAEHGVDHLEVEICLDMLEAAHNLNARS